MDKINLAELEAAVNEQLFVPDEAFFCGRCVWRQSRHVNEKCPVVEVERETFDALIRLAKAAQRTEDCPTGDARGEYYAALSAFDFTEPAAPARK